MYTALAILIVAIGSIFIGTDTERSRWLCFDMEDYRAEDFDAPNEDTAIESAPAVADDLEGAAIAAEEPVQQPQRPRRQMRNRPPAESPRTTGITVDGTSMRGRATGDSLDDLRRAAADFDPTMTASSIFEDLKNGRM